MWAKSQIWVTSTRFWCLLLLAASCLLGLPSPACSVVPLLRSGSWNRWRSSAPASFEGRFRRGDDATRTTTSPRTVSGSLDMAVPQTKEELFEVTKCCLNARAAREGRNRRCDASQRDHTRQ